MKKIILLFLFVFCLFIGFRNVSADAAVPKLTIYEAIVTNSKGAKALSGPDLDLQIAYFENEELTQSVIPYNQVVIVKEELGGMALIEYNGKKYAVDTNDISAKNTKYSLDKATHLDKAEEIITGYETDIYEGPSDKFKNLGKVPKNVILEYSYKAGDWLYIEYNGIKGWFQSQYGVVDNREITLLADYKDFEKTTIKKGTVLKCLYSMWHIRGVSCYVEYNGKKGWVLSDDYYDDIKYFNLEYVSEEEPEPSSQEEPVLEPSTQKEEPSIYNSVYLYICGAIIVAFTALVTIILINKKKNN